MIKRLPVFILLVLLFGAVHAQTHEGSTKNLPASVIEKVQLVDTTGKKVTGDTIVKKAVADTITKKTVIDTAVKKDTANLHVKTDTTIKTLVVKPAVDSAASKPVVDSLAKTSAIVKPLVDSVAKQPKIDSVTIVKSPENKKSGTYSVKVKITPPPPDKVIKHSPIKTLSDERYNAYLKGDDLDSMALVGEMNNYPLPDQALKYKVQIGLNPGQITKIKALATELHRKKVEMGDNIIRNEKMLDSLFHSRKIIDGTLIFYTNRSGLYYGELRGAILMACYNTEQILSDDQLKKLEALMKAH